MVNKKYKTTEDDDMNIKLPRLKGKTFFKISQQVSRCYDELNCIWQNGFFQFQEDLFAKHVQGSGKTFREVLIMIKFLQRKLQLKR